MVELKNDNGTISVRIEGEYSAVIAELSMLVPDTVSKLVGGKINESKLFKVLFEASKIELMLKRGMKYDSETDA